jgi:hypothetical protein
MAYQVSEYQGDGVYNIGCRGDVVVGDEVRFERATFTGSFRNAKFERFEMITGTVVADSYGYCKQQHTFTLVLSGGSKMLIKGRNLYRNGIWRKTWNDESARLAVADEKHDRGAIARLERDTRREGERGYSL